MWRFSYSLYRSSFSVFVAAPRSNSNLSLFSISWPFCADNAQADLSFYPWIGFYGVSLYRIWPQVIDAMVLVKPATVVAWHRKVSGSIGAFDHVVRDDPRSVQTSVI
jgi:hypothetical protein